MWRGRCENGGRRARLIRSVPSKKQAPKVCVCVCVSVCMEKTAPNREEERKQQTATGRIGIGVFGSLLHPFYFSRGYIDDNRLRLGLRAALLASCSKLQPHPVPYV